MSAEIAEKLGHAHLPFLPLLIVANEFFDCSRLEHAFDTQEQVDVSRDDPDRDGNLAPFFSCDRQPCPNRTPRSITTNEDEGQGTSYQSDESNTPAALHSGQARGDPHLPRRTEEVAQPTATPQAIPQPSLGPQLERPPKTEPRDTPPHSWASSSSAVTASTSVPVLRHPASGLPQPASPPSPPRGRPSTRSSRSPPGGQSQQSPSSAGSPSSPSSPIMSSPAAVPDKETLKLLLPLRYDGKSVIECNRFISQLLIYWTINTALSSLELKIQAFADDFVVRPASPGPSIADSSGSKKRRVDEPPRPLLRRPLDGASRLGLEQDDLDALDLDDESRGIIRVIREERAHIARRRALLHDMDLDLQKMEKAALAKGGIGFVRGAVDDE
ncbi:predicted protein [Postia placenta Mad-698-R]|nr:predicted protein [Postia placenta Mad-698-R]